MPFTEIPPKVDFPAQEREVLKFWKDTRAFEKMLALHKGQPHWSFIDGPITANNPMGVHHGWGRTYKDAMLRFRTMQGHEMRYQNGFDCQGLWVEVNVERELGFKSKKDIEAYGLATFVRKCKERVLRYAAVQTEQSIRLGYWADWNDPEYLRWLADRLMEDPDQVITAQGPDGPVTDTVEQIIGRLGQPELGGSYFTFSNENNFMIWALLKKCWQNGWVYRGDDVMPWCPRCATGLSQHEIVTEGYRELTHNSVTLRFPLRNRPHESLLVWTTTPWTLTSNIAAAVGPDLTYARVRQGEETYYLSKGTLHMLRGSYEILSELKGADLVGWTYDGPFDDLEAEQQKGGHTALVKLIRDVKQSAVEAHQVILWEAVGETEGTGIVHIATGCGAEDFQLGKEHHFPLVAPLDEEGHFVDGFGWLTGMHVSEVAQPIFDNLKQKGILYAVEPYTHRYPVCWRCDSELVFRLVDEWFISMGEIYDKPRESLTAEEKQRSLRYQIMDVVDQIKWIPEFGYAREMDWLHNMHDWMISKKRYWGLALPIWECPQCAHFEVIGSQEELQRRAITGLEVLDNHTPHRPYIDAVNVACPHCGATMSRVPDVGNPWLDAGIVSISTLRYRTDPAFWRKWYPAHWISESFPGQFRNWFYSLLAMGTVMTGEPPFLQNFSYAMLLGEDGRPMHKSWGNAIEFSEGADKMGVDVMRWLFCNHQPENDLWFGYHGGDETRRQFLIPLWNVYSFFVTYARLDGWIPAPLSPVPFPLKGEGENTGNLDILGSEAAQNIQISGFTPACPEGPTPVSANLLDRWILARLNQVTARVTDCLDGSIFTGAGQAVNELIDDLTNWFVRRSRRRFWKSEADEDKSAAYATLYHVLVKLIRLLAPMVPFVTEVMYQNLVRGVQPGAYESVHHTTWPVCDRSVIDEKLIEQMALTRRIASLGLSARSSNNLKVRQPLAKVLVYAGNMRLSDDLVEVVLDELNVKAFEWVDSPERLVSYRILPDNKLLGPKFGAKFPRLRAALQAADPSELAASVRDGLPVTLMVDGESVELAPTEILVSTQPVEGLAVAADKAITVAVDAVVTPELRAEGLAREIVRRVQEMRKNAGFEIADRITTYYQADAPLAEVMQTWASYFQAETLTVELVAGPPPAEAYCEDHTLDGKTVKIGVLKHH
jgi:isoleucyl-tRNA synthetase